MQEINWRKKYLELFHISQNILMLLERDVSDNLKARRSYDRVIDTHAEQLRDHIESIPDNAFAKGAGDAGQSGEEKREAPL